MDRELTTADKWAPVDNMIAWINQRGKGALPLTPTEEYVNHHFNKKANKANEVNQSLR